MKIKLLPFTIVVVVFLFSFFSFIIGTDIFQSLLVVSAFLAHVFFQYWVRGNTDLMIKPCEEIISKKVSIKNYEMITTMLFLLFIATNIAVSTSN